MLAKVKTALRISTNVFDQELTDLINAAKLDLGIAGVVIPAQIDELVTRAIITFCKMSFGIPDDYEHLKASYDEQKSQLITAEDYTDFKPWEASDNV